MRSCSLSVMLIGLAAVAAVAGMPLPAGAAGPTCEHIDARTGVCSIVAEQPAPPRPGTSDPISDEGPSDSGAGSACVNDLSIWNGSTDVVPVPCTSDAGYWSNAYGCYIRLLDPQPVADPALVGQRGEGAMYSCVIPPPHGGSTYVWLEEAPEPAAQGPSPRAVAEMAVDSMNLEAIEIGIVPEPGEGKVGVVGMPVWMWAANPGPASTGPNTATASAGGVTITATATVEDITWSMGDGTTVVCDGPGTPYTDGAGLSASPDCGHTYTTSSATQPGQRFTVTATSDWVVEWEGAGQTGTIRLDDLSRSVQIAVGEVQVLVQQ